MLGRNTYDLNYLAKFNAKGDFLWSKALAVPANMDHTSINQLNETKNGDIWLLGNAYEGHFGNNRTSYKYTQRMSGLGTDTIYTKYFGANDTIDVQQLFRAPEGDQIIGFSWANRNSCVHCAYQALTFYNEQNSAFTKYIHGIAQTVGHWSGTSPEDGPPTFTLGPGGEMFISYFYQNGITPDTYRSFFVLNKLDKDEKTSSCIGKYISSAPNGNVLVLNEKGEIALHDKELKFIKVLPGSFYPLAQNESIMQTMPSQDGGLLVLGSFKWPNSNKLFLMKLDIEGNIIWKVYYSEDTYNFYDMKETADGGIVFLTRGNDNNLRLVKTDNQGLILGSNETLEKTTIGVTLYPNPSNGNLVTLAFAKSFTGTIHLQDKIGKRLLTKEVTTTQSHVLELPPAITAGVYFLQVKDAASGRTQTVRFLKN